MDGPAHLGSSSIARLRFSSATPRAHTHTPNPQSQSHRRSALLLGHTASVGTCLALSPDGARLASGDRDEKVRVSRFPCTLVVEGYLTGEWLERGLERGV